MMGKKTEKKKALAIIMQLPVILLGIAVMVAFAANSVLCRLALVRYGVDPGEVTGIRIVSGALVLLPVFLWKTKGLVPISSKSIFPGLALLAYTYFFSIAYVRLDTGSGALILFGAVQVTMIGFSIIKGNIPSTKEWIGIMLAMAGLGYMLFPGSAGPSLLGASLMAASGIAWGIYSFLGKRERDPIFSTARNFLVAAPVGVFLILPQVQTIEPGNPGVLMAILSGALTSGLGYLLWYLLLDSITIPVAAVLQLSVPAIAALGGVIFSDEQITSHFLIASGITITGILLTIFGKKKVPSTQS